jgi:glycosyltransferase involved in cell wall biosynthesis
MRIAFVGHSHHLRTGSSSFFLERLRARADVQLFWDRSWIDGAPLDVGPILRGRFDAVVVWQIEAVAAELARHAVHNLTFVPMYDGCHAMPDSFWASLRDTKVVCFSSTLFEKLQRLGVRSRHARYFPDPAPLAPVAWEGGLRGYFWQRQQDVTWHTLRPLLGAARFERFTLHRAVDPTFGVFVPPTPDEVARHGVRFTDWFADRDAHRRDLAAHHVYFAPRVREGIGLSFLEAMAMGMLVVAPDRPTMNEYLVSGVNGLLYDPERPAALDFTRAAALGARARRTVELGRAKWVRCLDGLVQFVLRPGDAAEPPAPLDALDPWALACPAPPLPRNVALGVPGPPRARERDEGGNRLRRRGQPHAPAVTVAVVTRNAEATLRPTLESILRQGFADREILVLDGASEDGTVDVIRRHDAALEYWRSEPDGGPYEAMNAAADLARGRWILFMNAGDVFRTTDALALALDGAPADADVIFGHHVYRRLDGLEELHRAAAFDETWERLRRGEVGWRWLSRVPGHQATLTRTALLRADPYDVQLRIAADHELLYRLARRGARFHHADAVLATYAGGGLSWRSQERCFEEWRRIALRYTERPATVERVFEEMRRDLRRDLLGRLPWGPLLLQAFVRGDARSLAARRLRELLRARRRARRARGAALPAPARARPAQEPAAAGQRPNVPVADAHPARLGP